MQEDENRSGKRGVEREEQENGCCQSVPLYPEFREFLLMICVGDSGNFSECACGAVKCAW